MNLSDLLAEIDRLPVHERWRLVHPVLRSLEHEQTKPKTDWHVFLRATYGSLRDTPIERWEQGEYEEREPLESSESRSPTPP